MVTLHMEHLQTLTVKTPYLLHSPYTSNLSSVFLCAACGGVTLAPHVKAPYSRFFCGRGLFDPGLWNAACDHIITRGLWSQHTTV